MDNIKVDIKQYDGEASIWLRAVESEGFKNILIKFRVLQNVGYVLTIWEI